MILKYKTEKPSRFSLLIAKSVFLLSLLFSQISFSQVNTYVFSQSQSTYEELTDATIIATATGTSGSASLDDVKYDNIVIPFSFTFGTQTFTSLNINSNGYVNFGAAIGASNTAPLSSGTTSGVISPLGADLSGMFEFNGKTATIETKTLGEAPNQVFVIEWKHFKYYSNSVTNHYDYNFQIRLHQNGTINFAYNFSVIGSPSSLSAQVGVRGNTTSDFQNRNAAGNNTSNWSNTTQGTNTYAVVTSTSTFLPTSGLNFNWSLPEPCVTPTEQPTNLVLSNTGIIINGSFNNSVPAADRYLILRTLSETTPNDPTDGIVYSVGQNETLNAYVSYYGSNTAFEENYNAGGIRGNNQYTYTIYAVSATCSGGPLYNTTNQLSESITNCPLSVSGLTANTITDNSIQLNWAVSENGTALPYNTIIEVATDNTFETMISGSPFTISSTDLTLAIAGLNENTKYYFRGKNVSVCDSGYSSIGSAYTICLPTSAFSENFDSTSTLPNCWSTIAVGAGGPPTINVTSTSDYVFSAPNGVTFYGNGADLSNLDNKLILVGPKLTNVGSGTHRLRFKAKKSSTSGTHAIRVVALISNTADATIELIASIPTTEITTTFKQFSINFDNYSGTASYIGIQRIDGSSYSYMSVDDVSWEEIPTCGDVENLTASSVTKNSATLSWEGSGIYYDVEYGIQGFIPTGTPTADLSEISNNYLLSNLTETTSYHYYVRQNCSATNNGFGVWSGPFAFTTLTSGQIGAGTTTISNFPIESNYVYSYSQQIYLNSELTAVLETGQTLITKIRFKQVSLGANPERYNNWTVYLGNTSLSGFETATSWIPVSELEQSFSGELAFAANSWIEITLDTPFSWDGTSNLAVAVSENVTGYSNSNFASYAATGTNRGIMYRSDSAQPDPLNPPVAYTRSSTIAQIQIVAESPIAEPCAPIVSFHYNFDDFTTFPEQCWSSNVSGPIMIGTTGTTNKAVQLYSFSSTNPIYMISPAVSTINGNYAFKYDINSISEGATIEVGTLASQTDFASFTPVTNEFAPIAGTTYLTTAIPATLEHKYIAIKFIPNGVHRVLTIDNVQWDLLSTLGTKPVFNKTFSIYPNPTNDIATIQSNEEINQVRIYNQLGQLISNKKDKTIDLSDKPTGMYLIEVEFNNNTTAIKKLLKK